MARRLMLPFALVALMQAGAAHADAIDGDGVFTALQAGTTTLRASLEDVSSDGSSIKVVDQPTIVALQIYPLAAVPRPGVRVPLRVEREELRRPGGDLARREQRVHDRDVDREQHDDRHGDQQKGTEPVQHVDEGSASRLLKERGDGDDDDQGTRARPAARNRAHLADPLAELRQEKFIQHGNGELAALDGFRIAKKIFAEKPELFS